KSKTTKKEKRKTEQISITFQGTAPRRSEREKQKKLFFLYTLSFGSTSASTQATCGAQSPPFTASVLQGLSLSFGSTTTSVGSSLFRVPPATSGAFGASGTVLLSFDQSTPAQTSPDDSSRPSHFGDHCTAFGSTPQSGPLVATISMGRVTS
ncbi:hypothetical protein IFM89_020150, partial [Coptis chinensis]